MSIIICFAVIVSWIYIIDKSILLPSSGFFFCTRWVLILWVHTFALHYSWTWHTYCAYNVQCVAVCCSVLQCVAVWYSVLQCVAVCCSVIHCVAVCSALCNTVQQLVVWCSVLLCIHCEHNIHIVHTTNVCQHSCFAADMAVISHTLYTSFCTYTQTSTHKYPRTSAHMLTCAHTYTLCVWGGFGQ